MTEGQKQAQGIMNRLGGSAATVAQLAGVTEREIESARRGTANERTIQALQILDDDLARRHGQVNR